MSQEQAEVTTPEELKPQPEGKKPMAEDSLIRELQARITLLEQQLTQREQQLTQREQDYNNALEELQAQIDANSELETLATDGEGKIGELEAKIRSMTSERAFDQIAEKLGIRPDAKADAWKLADFKSDGDEPDLEAMEKHFGKFLESRKHFMGEGEQKETKKLPVDENAGRGPSKSQFDNKLRATYAQLNDLDWMDRNFEAIGQASREGNFEIIPS